MKKYIFILTPLIMLSGQLAAQNNALRIVRIETDPVTVSQGQTGIIVNMVLENRGGLLSQPISEISGSLIFKKDNKDLTDEYVQTRINNNITIQPDSEGTLSFEVEVKAAASLETITIDGRASGTALLSRPTANGAAETDSWTVQAPAELIVDKIEASSKSVMPGESITVTVNVKNGANGKVAIAEIDSVKLRLLHKGLDRSADFEIEMIGSPTSIPGGEKETFGFFVNVQASASAGDYLIDAAAYGRDANSNVAISDTSVNGPAKITVQRPAQLTVQSVTTPFSSVSIGRQTIPVFVNVRNDISESAVVEIDSVKLKFLRNGIDLSTHFVVTPDIGNPTSIAGGADAIFEFDVDASEDAVSGLYLIDAAVYGHDANNNPLNDPDAEQPANLLLQTAAVLRVDFTSIEPIQTLGDTFQVEARVQNLGEAEVNNSGRLRLHIPTRTGYRLLLSGMESQPFVVDSTVTWEVIAPATTTESDTFIVEISPVPLELNSNLPARLVLAGKDTSIVQTTTDSTGGDGFITIDSVRVDQPEGAKDGILSTEQHVTIVAYLHRHAAVKVQTQISGVDFYNFVGSDDFTKVIADDAGDTVAVTWNLRAPADARGPHNIRVEVFGLDEQSNRRIETPPDSLRDHVEGIPLPVSIVRKASLSLEAEITAPPSARDGSLTVEQEFMIAAELTNAGVAGVVGESTIEITLPNAFSTSDSLRQRFTVGQTPEVTWRILAPPSPGAFFIKLNVDQAANDENNGEPATVAINQVSIPVSVGDVICLIAAPVDNSTPRTVVRGARDVSLLSMNLENTASVEVRVESIRMMLKNKENAAIPPNIILSRMKVVSQNSGVAYADLTALPAQNPFLIAFNPAIVVPALANATLDFRVDVLPQTQESTLGLVIETPATDIVAVDADRVGVAIKAPFCQNFTSALADGFAMLSDADLDANFFNFPNPFVPSERSETQFHYFLENDTEVVIRIYTLLGELVWSEQYSEDTEQGRAGVHDGLQNPTIEWNGTNDKNQPVLNGVYVAVLTTATGTAYTKIAVAK